MTLNPNIILAGQTPNLVRSFAQGQLAGAQGNDIQRQNALNALYQDQGPQIASAVSDESLERVARQV